MNSDSGRAIKLGINPLPWAFQLDQKSLRAGFSAVVEAGFTAVQADILEWMTISEYQGLLDEFGLGPAPIYLAAQFENSRWLSAELDKVRWFAARQTELGATSVFLAGEMASLRLERPGVGAPLGVPLSLIVDNVTQDHS